ncbi:MAG TPA: glucose-6-phosphate dehydrogenase [Candidatus Binatia bacterium]|nr:glucose-6-phosphate dehydrogenase [Candidatus Binatia bacterium]
MTAIERGSRLTASVSPARRESPVEPGSELIRAKDPFTLVIFGASGDLAKRKLIPALYHLRESGYLADRYAVLGFSRTPMSDEAYRDVMRKVLSETVNDGAGEVPADNELVSALYYHAGDADKPPSFQSLKAKIEKVERERDLPGNRLFYLSVAPELFPVIVENLAAAGLIHDETATAWSRVIIEKPFGHDLESARALNAAVTKVLSEDQIYRIDHYLGKETVQNILSFRFGNSIFEPLFNQKYIDNIQITVAETLGMEGRRGAYYDTAGALRDMVQNHMLQLLCLIAMEPPSGLEAQSIRDEKVKVMRALDPLTRKEVAESTVRGQYGVGEQDGKVVKGYRQEEGVNPKSVTETYVALRIRIDNWRWAGVPFLLRSGKRLAKRVSEIAVEFKQPPMHLFRQFDDSSDEVVVARPKSNLLLLRIQPDEGISLSFACKRPGIKIQLDEVHMDFFYGRAFQQRSPEAYERLLLDALRGDPSLFTRSDEVDYAWRFITSIHQGWASLPPPVFPNYYPFTDGPDEANRLLEGTQARWRSLAEM